MEEVMHAVTIFKKCLIVTVSSSHFVVCADQAGGNHPPPQPAPVGFVCVCWVYLSTGFETELIGPGGFACATRGGVAMRSWPLLLHTFGLFSSFPSFAFDPLRGISRA